jgi:hypothetical protein
MMTRQGRPSIDATALDAGLERGHQRSGTRLREGFAMSLHAGFGKIAAIWFGLGLVLILATPASAAGMANDWVGAYGYEDGREAVYFNMSISRNGNVLTGHIVETQTFGSPSPDGTLKASIKGSINGHVVTFTKTYDGSGGQTHSVTYRGTLVSDGNSSFMFGTWHIGSDVGSWFATVPSE